MYLWVGTVSVCWYWCCRYDWKPWWSLRSHPFPRSLPCPQPCTWPTHPPYWYIYCCWPYVVGCVCGELYCEIIVLVNGVCLSVGLATGIAKLIHYRVVFFPIPRTSAWLIPRLCPLIFSVLLFPSGGGSGPPSLLPCPPSQILPDSLSPSVRPFPLVFLCLLSVRVI